VQRVVAVPGLFVERLGAALGRRDRQPGFLVEHRHPARVGVEDIDAMDAQSALGLIPVAARVDGKILAGRAEQFPRIMVVVGRRGRGEAHLELPVAGHERLDRLEAHP